MKKYKYLAQQGDRSIRGTFNGNSRDEVVDMLRDKQMIVMDIVEIKTNPLVASLSKLQQKPPSLMEKVIFCKQMGAMMKASIRLPQALSTQTRQTKNQFFVETIQSIIRGIESGNTLHNAMYNHPKVFSPVFLSLIRTGEETGNLDQIFVQMASMMEKDMILARKVKSALTYPAVVLVFAFLLCYYLLSSIIPQFTKILTDLQAELPAITKFMMWLSTVITNYGVLIVISMVGFVILFQRFYSTLRGRRLIDPIILKIPVVGLMLQKTILARFCRASALMFRNGIKINQILEISKGVMGNQKYVEAIEDIDRSVKHGYPIPVCFNRHPELFPPIMLSMIETGTEAGRLDQLLGEAAEIFEQEAMETAENLANVLEPVMTIFIGGIILTIVLAMFLPYFAIIAKLSGG